MSNMVVRTNIFSLNAHRNMKNVGLEQRRASNRLSSGYRINSAADDAAGLAISETMRAQIRGLDQASRNAQDGQAMLLTTEGGLEEIGNMLQRVRELLVQSSNDTNTQDQRNMIEQEVNQLSQEIGSMQQRVEFNTNRVLAMGPALATSISNVTAQIERDALRVSDAFSRIDENARFVADAREMLAGLSGTTQFGDMNQRQQNLIQNALADVDLATVVGTSTTQTAGVNNLPANVTSTLTAAATMGETARAAMYSSVRAEGTAAGTVAFNNVVAAATLSHSGYVAEHIIQTGAASVAYDTGQTAAMNAALTLAGEASAAAASVAAAVTADAEAARDTAFIPSNASAAAITVLPAMNFVDATQLTGLLNARTTALSDRSGSLNTIRAQMLTAAEVQFEAMHDFANFRDSASSGDFVAFFQVGANANQGISFDFESVSRTVSSAAAVVNMTSLLVANPGSGGGIGRGIEVSPLISQIQASLDDINSIRANLGAVQNRMDFTMRSLDISSENLQDSESRVRNADMAREMMRFTMSNVLQQASISMLSQANQMPNNLLQILR